MEEKKVKKEELNEEDLKQATGGTEQCDVNRDYCKGKGFKYQGIPCEPHQ